MVPPSGSYGQSDANVTLRKSLKKRVLHNFKEGRFQHRHDAAEMVADDDFKSG
jgi:hypothetical protein